MKITKKIKPWIVLGVASIIPIFFTISCGKNIESWLTRDLRKEFTNIIIINFQKKYKISFIKDGSLKKLIMPKNESESASQLYFGVDSINKKNWNFNSKSNDINTYIKKIKITKKIINKTFVQLKKMNNKFSKKMKEYLEKSSYKYLNDFLDKIDKIIFKDLNKRNANEEDDLNRLINQKNFIVSFQLDDTYKNLFDIKNGTRYNSISYQLSPNIKHQIARDFFEAMLNGVYQFAFYLSDLYDLLPN